MAKPKTLLLCWVDEEGLHPLPDLLMSVTLNNGVVCIPIEDGARVVGPNGSTGVYNLVQMRKAIKSLQEKKVVKCCECGEPADGVTADGFMCQKCFSRTPAEEKTP